MTERSITLTFTSGARVDLPQREAAWLRDELLARELEVPRRDAGLVVDRALTAACDDDADIQPADMTAANLVELAWALRGMQERDANRFVGSPLLMHLRDLVFIELTRE
jgi:hypothetical protein